MGNSMGYWNVRLLREPLSETELHRDPWDLPSYFFVTKEKFFTISEIPGVAVFRRPVRKLFEPTVSGYWKENKDELTAIRSGESSSSTTATVYIGLRRTLEFYLKDGTKTGWVTHEYIHLHHDNVKQECQYGERPLFLQDQVVIRKVFRKEATHQTSSRYRKSSDDADDVRTIHLCEQLQDKADSLLESAEGNPMDCITHGKSDYDVWKHFTKIRSTSDPGEVYAVCHRCDKVLKAHSKKHGTNHLKRHRESDKCRLSCSNPSTDEDREILGQLREVLDNLSEQQKMDQKLAFEEHLAQLDPWDLNLNPCYVYVTSSFNQQTHGGLWKEVKKDFIAIRMEQPQIERWWKQTTTVQMVDLMQKQLPPQFIGLRRTLEFYTQDGNKTDLLMHQYQQVDDNNSPALLLQGHLVIRKVFCHDKAAASFDLTEWDRLLNGDDDDDKEYFNGEGVNTDTTTPSDYMDTPCFGFPLDEGMNTDTTTSNSDYMDSPCFVFPLGEGINTDTATSSSDYMDTPVLRKRKRTGAASGHKSEVWVHFTKIYNTDYDLVYVVCHTCDRGYTSGGSKNGTSHLKRHHKSCSSKRCRTGNANDATTEWVAEIRPRFLSSLQ